MQVRLLVPFLLLITASGAGAQAQALSTTVADARGDVTFSPMPEGIASYPSGPDLVEVSVQELADVFELGLRVELGDDPTIFNGRVQTWMEFAIGEAAYVVADPSRTEGVPGPALYALDGSGQTRFIAGLDGTTDESATHMRVAVPRELLLDENAAPPLPDSQFAMQSVFVGGPYASLGVMIQAYDSLDEPGGLAGSFALGAPQEGPIRISSTAPYRSSNGEVGTFVFDVLLRNVDSRDHDVLLEASDLPEGWHAYFPNQGRFSVPASESHPTFVVVTTPFAHGHGRVEEVSISAHALDGGETSHLTLGVRYLPFPQPAGHHDTLYLHSLASDPPFPGYADVYGDDAQAFMSTTENDDKSHGVPVRADSNTRPLDEIKWTIPLDPQLALGLEFDPSRQGVLDATITADGPVLAASARADLVLVHGQERRTLASSPVVALGDLAPQQSVSLELVMEALEGKVPHAQGSELELVLVLESNRPTYLAAKELPHLQPGGWLRLPLLEYQDPLPVSLTDLGHFRVAPIGDQQRIANPGEVLLFQAMVSNDGENPLGFDVSLEGAGAAQAAFVGPSSATVAPGAQWPLNVRLDVPMEARQNDLFEVVLVASETESSLATLLKYSTIVDSRAEHPGDEGKIAQLDVTEPDAKASSHAVPFLLVGLLLCIRRR